MQPFLGLFFFFMLLATGSSLKCEDCMSPGKNCTGPELFCGDDKACVITFTEASVDKIVENIWKGCESSKVCEYVPFSMTLGQGKTVRMKTVCCTGDACKSVTPELPPVNNKTNGMKCPACYSLTGLCPAEVVHCTGSEDHCFMIDSRKNTGRITVNILIKGCATIYACQDPWRASVALLGIGNTYSSSSCVPATATATATEAPPSQASPSTGFSLLALSELLVMKMLF